MIVYATEWRLWSLCKVFMYFLFGIEQFAPHFADPQSTPIAAHSSNLGKLPFPSNPPGGDWACEDQIG